MTISDTTTGAAIYYTTNGSTPTTGSTLYGGPITVSATETVQAIAAASGYTNSGVGSALYTITPPAATPTFSPVAGSYTSAQTVTISDTTPGAIVYYTTTGATPTTSSTVYSAPISVASTETLKAIATASGYAASAVASAAYTINIPSKTTPTVTVTPASSSITMLQPLSITVTVTGSGNTPTGTVTVAGGSYASAAISLAGGSAIINIPAGAMGAGSVSLTINYAPDTSSASSYNSAAGAATVTVSKVTPAITWATPAAITYGAALSGTQLNAASGGVAGTYAYTPAAGAVLSAGSQRLSVVFTPTDSTDYNSASSSVMLTVTPAVLTVTAANASRAYGAANPQFTASISGFVNGDTSSAVTGSANLTTTATASSTVGTYPITASQGTLAAANYSFAFVNGTLSITQVTPTITWAAPAVITYGTPLNGAQLNATSTAAGTFTYTPAAGAVLSAGSQRLSVVFTPTDSTDYNSASSSVTLTVNPAVLTVTAANASRACGAANPQFTSSLSGFVNGDTSSAVTGSASLTTTATASSTVGTYPITASQGTLAAANYSFAFVNGTLSITQVTPAITWAAPAAITYGTPLNGAQLNATSTAAGTFTYTPAAGAVLSAGSQRLSVVFTPTIPRTITRHRVR